MLLYRKYMGLCEDQKIYKFENIRVKEDKYDSSMPLETASNDMSKITVTEDLDWKHFPVHLHHLHRLNKYPILLCNTVCCTFH